MKEHQSRYAPMGEDESARIVDEMIARRAGETLDEDEDVIEAIKGGHLQDDLYKDMADDLEAARRANNT